MVTASVRWFALLHNEPSPLDDPQASSDVELLRVVPERAEAHAEHLRRLHLHAARALEREGNVVTIEVLAARLEVEPLAEVRQYHPGIGDPESGVRIDFHRCPW